MNRNRDTIFVYLPPALVLFGLFSLPPAVLAGESRSSLKGEGITIYYDPSLQQIAESIQSGYPEIRSGVEKKIGWKLKSGLTVYMLDDEKGFARMGGSPGIAAFALIGRGRIVMNLASFEEMIQAGRIFRHELCHVLLHDHIRAPLPDWLEEGICEWVAEPADQNVATVITAPFNAFALSEHAVPLNRLRSFHGSGTGLGLAYSESGNFISYLANTYGERSIRGLLEHIRRGESPQAAFPPVFSKSLPAMESQWRVDLAYKARWFTFPQRFVTETVQSGRIFIQTLLPRYRTLLLYVLAFIAAALFIRAMFRPGRRLL